MEGIDPLFVFFAFARSIMEVRFGARNEDNGACQEPMVATRRAAVTGDVNFKCTLNLWLTMWIRYLEGTGLV
jgi:hypothetical protein